MKLSTKGRYGLRALIDLAVHCEREAVPISSVAARQGISESYLEQLFGKMRKAGLIVSERGAQGGADKASNPIFFMLFSSLLAFIGKYDSLKQRHCQM